MYSQGGHKSGKHRKLGQGKLKIDQTFREKSGKMPKFQEVREKSGSLSNTLLEGFDVLVLFFKTYYPANTTESFVYPIVRGNSS